MKKIFLFITILLSVSCNRNNSYVSKYFNDVDMALAWTDSQNLGIIPDADAHSGIYVCLLDSSKPYSTTFDLKSTEAALTDYNKMHFSVWIKAGSDKAKPKMVIDFRDAQTGQTLDFQTKFIAGDEFITNNKWTEYNFDLNLDNDKRKGKNISYRVYCMNDASVPVAVDDLTVEFY